ncbi:MAG: DUF4175 domain-containing protein [Flavobacteriales bacterium]|nr:hypothetical protein [Flavobacteriales bacterium]MCB9167083.1 DUF4175 domain-containing protein [Flavobacteriales bacterium]
MQSDRELLVGRLDAFIRRYYQDQLLRGLLYSVGLLAIFYLGVTLSEYFGRFGPDVRSVLFWGYLAAAGIVLLRNVLSPAAKWFRLGAVITHAEAARIIGAHFGEVADKLLNTLQLQEQAGSAPNRELIEASIAQRSRELGRVPFARAIDLRRNTRYLRYAVPPLAILMLLLIAAPSMITGPTQRILRHGTEFVPEAPFRFLIMNDSLAVPEQEDFDLEVHLEGDVVPQQAAIVLDGREFPLVKEGAGRFHHRFRNVQEATAFRLTAEGFNSSTYTLAVLPNPTLMHLAMTVDPPAYVGEPRRTVNNMGDITVPAGTRITWTIGTRSARTVEMAFDDSTYSLGPVAQDAFSMSRRFLRGNAYRVVPRNGAIAQGSPLEYHVQVLPDLYPTIAVEERVDSLALKQRYFHGTIGDDHGLSRLQFHYRFITGGDSVASEDREGIRDLPVDRSNTRQDFYHAWDLADLRIQPGDRLEYWFDVWDNDGVSGAKRTRSNTLVFEAPTLNELAAKQQQQNEAIESALRSGIKEAQDLQGELEKLRRDMLDKKDLDWQDQQKLQNVVDRQKQLQERISRTTDQLRMSQEQRTEFQKIDQRLLDKQQQLENLFENVMSEEMKDLYRQVQEMLDKLDKDKLQEKMEDLKLSQEDIEKELDRSLELFKRMEVEQKAQDIADRLNDLAERQDQLGEKAKEDPATNEDLQKQQDELNKEFEDIRKEMKELEEENKELDDPLEIPNTEEQQEQIQEQQQQSSEQLQQEQNNKASESQKKAAEQMQQLAFQMQSGMRSGEQQQQEEDMDALRQLLENIVQLSFDQEALMGGLQDVSTKDPRFIELGRAQKDLRDDSKVIEDSLLALSKRVPQLQSIVNREMNAVNSNMDEAMDHIGEARVNDRHRPMAADNQQRAMTSLNNLALLLDEALQQMMQQMAMQMPGNGSCNKPGGTGSGQGNKPSLAKMKAQQQALSKQLEAMRKALEEQRKGKKPGQQNGGGQMPGMSKQLASLAAQQAAIRKEMQRLAQEMNADGSGAGNGLNKLAEEMEQNEKDVVNKRIDQETVRRQQDIMVRLLEAEKAERERELDKKRTSMEGKEQPPEDPARFFEYQRRKAREAELLRTVPAGLKPYYRDRVNDYFGTFDRP